jgi:predicted dehydrogenase
VDYTHDFDFIRWIFGEVTGVTAASATLGDLEIRPEPNVMQIILRTAAGSLVQVHMDYVQHPQRRILEVYGDRDTAA